MTRITAKDVAEYFLDKTDVETGENFSNLKIQKLVYYVQGVYLAIYDKPMFDDPIQAWTHGPVVASLYHDYKSFGDGPIEPNQNFSLNKFDENQIDVLDTVWRAFGQYSAWTLRDMTHEESPWISAYAKCPGATITHQALTEYFKTIVTVD